MTGSTRARSRLAAPGQHRLSMSDKHGIVQQLLRIGGGQPPSGAHVKAVAERHGVAVRSVYRWLADPAFAQEAVPEPRSRSRFEIDVNHLTVIADEQNYFTAWERMRAAGVVDCSYQTFARALHDRTDPALVRAALDGMKGLVNNRLYLSWLPPHRNHTFHLDHTQMDLWVWPSHKERLPVRPYVTVVTDGATGLIHAVPWYTDVNGDMVAAALAEATIEREYYGVLVGGCPEQVILDNAAAHFGPAMRAGVERLGWILAPTGSYSSWQNGKAERTIEILNDRLSRRAPGSTNAGTTRTGANRHAAPLPRDIKKDEVFSRRTFEAVLQQVVDEVNTTIKMDRHGGRTRLEAYAADPTERRPLTPSVARLSMLTSGLRTVKVTKNGLQFEKRHYLATFLEYGRRYLIRYLPTVRTFVEVFDEQGEYLGQALWQEALTPEDRSEFLKHRAEQEKQARAIEAGTQAHRRHMAAVLNNELDYGEDDEDEPDRVEAAPSGTGLVADVTRMPSDLSDGQIKRRRAAKASLPRVPAPARLKVVRDNEARQGATDRLNAAIAKHFPDFDTKETS